MYKNYKYVIRREGFKTSLDLVKSYHDLTPRFIIMLQQ